MQAFPFVFSVSSFLSHFFQCILSLLLSQPRCFPSTLSPPTHSRILRTPLLRSAPGQPWGPHLPGESPSLAPPRDWQWRSVEDGARAARWRHCRSGPQRSPRMGIQGGKHSGDPAVKAERCKCACFRFLGSEGPSISCSAGWAHFTPSAHSKTRVSR